MIIEINYFTVAMLAAIASALVSAFWMIGRTFLQQYGSMLRDQLADHRADISARQETNQRLLDQVEAAIDAHAGRIARLEHDLRAAVTHGDIKRLHSRIDGVVQEMHGTGGDVKALDQKVDSIGKTLGLIHEFMLTGGNK